MANVPILEIWKEIHSHPLYYVSNRGLIKKGDKLVMLRKKYSECNKDGSRRLSGMRVFINIGRKQINKPVHFLVLNTFNPNPNPLIYTSVDHIDRNTENNNLENLRWSNPKMQALNRGNKRKKRIKFSMDLLDIAYHRLKKHESLNTVGEDYGISGADLSKLLIWMHPLY